MSTSRFSTPAYIAPRAVTRGRFRNVAHAAPPEPDARRKRGTGRLLPRLRELDEFTETWLTELPRP